MSTEKITQKKIDAIRSAAEKLHMYLMNNHGTIYVCKKCGRQDFYETIGTLGSDTGMICDCGCEDFHEYCLNEYHDSIIAMCDTLEAKDKEIERLENCVTEAIKRLCPCDSQINGCDDAGCGTRQWLDKALNKKGGK